MRGKKALSRYVVLFFSLKFVANCSSWLVAVHPAISLNAAQKHPTDLLVSFLFSEFPFPEIDAQVTQLLKKNQAPRTD